MTTDYGFEVQNRKNEICTGAKLKNGVLHLRNEIVILSSFKILFFVSRHIIINALGIAVCIEGEGK